MSALSPSPKLVHPVEFRPLLWQPNKDDAQRPGQGWAPGGGVAGGLVQHQPDWPSGVGLAQKAEKSPKALLPQTRAAIRWPNPVISAASANLRPLATNKTA